MHQDQYNATQISSKAFILLSYKILSKKMSKVSLHHTKLLSNEMRACLYRRGRGKEALGEGRVPLSILRHISKSF